MNSSGWGVVELGLPNEAADFYLLEYMAGAHDYKPAKGPLKRKVKFLADAMYRYFTYALWSELSCAPGAIRRHEFSDWYHDKPRKRIPYKCKPGTVARKLIRAAKRDRLFQELHPRLFDRRRGTTLKAIMDIFYKENWTSGYGGEPWGDIARVLYKHQTKKITPKVFVDTLWSIEHNGGCAFDKSGKMHGTGSLSFVLDAQSRTDVEELLRHASLEVKLLMYKFQKRVGRQWLTKRDLS